MKNKLYFLYLYEEYASLLKTAAAKVIVEEKNVSLFLYKLVAYIGGSIKVVKEPNEYEINGGSLVVNEDGSFIINLPPFTSPLRDNFTIAHELGHYFIHYINSKKQGFDAARVCKPA